MSRQVCFVPRQRFSFDVAYVVPRGPFDERLVILVHVASGQNALAETFAFAVAQSLNSSRRRDPKKNDQREIEHGVGIPASHAAGQNPTRRSAQVSRDQGVAIIRRSLPLEGRVARLVVEVVAVKMRHAQHVAQRPSNC